MLAVADDFLQSIDTYFGHPKMDRRGERWPLCPFHPDRRPGSFSYGPRGYTCFACGAQGGLRKLAEHLRLETRPPLPAPRPRVPQPTPRLYDWQRDPEYWRRFLPLPQVALDYYHGRGFTDETIARWRLGYGVLPASRCKFPRLVLPVFDAGRLVGLRGRALDPADLDAKWLCAAGSKTTLFGADTLAHGRPVIVAEAPYSAILATQQASHVAAVASTAPAHWQRDWTDRIKASDPAWVLVWYDHDEAGEVNGRRVYEALSAAGLRVRRYPWPRAAAEKRDLADLVKETGQVPVSKPPPLCLAGVDRAYW